MSSFLTSLRVREFTDFFFFRAFPLFLFLSGTFPARGCDSPPPLRLSLNSLPRIAFFLLIFVFFSLVPLFLDPFFSHFTLSRTLFFLDVFFCFLFSILFPPHFHNVSGPTFGPLSHGAHLCTPPGDTPQRVRHPLHKLRPRLPFFSVNDLLADVLFSSVFPFFGRFSLSSRHDLPSFEY